MKRFLLAGGAIVALSAAAFALDGEGKQDARGRTGADHRILVGGNGPVVELRGAGGERTLHMERDGNDTVLTLNGQTVEIRNGTVTIDGQEIEAGPHSVVVVDGEDIRVIDGDFEFEFDTEFAAHMAERAEHMARMHADLADGFAFGFTEDFDGDFALDVEGIQAEVLATLEETLAGLDRENFHASREWDELSEEEREEVREAMREAREEVREAMEEVRAEMRNVEREMEGERRRIRVEMRDAHREIERAEREIERATRERHRAEMRHEARNEARADAHGLRETLRIHRHDDEARIEDRRSIRVEEDDSGRRRVWIDGEEQTGDDLTQWLNQLEGDRLAGAPGSREPHMQRHVERLELHDGDERRVIELDGGNRVVILDRRETEND